MVMKSHTSLESSREKKQKFWSSEIRGLFSGAMTKRSFLYFLPFNLTVTCSETVEHTDRQKEENKNHHIEIISVSIFWYVTITNKYK